MTETPISDEALEELRNELDERAAFGLDNAEWPIDDLRALLARIDAGEKVDETRLEAAKETARNLGIGMPAVLQATFAEIAENAIRRYFAYAPPVGSGRGLADANTKPSP